MFVVRFLVANVLRAGLMAALPPLWKTRWAGWGVTVAVAFVAAAATAALVLQGIAALARIGGA